MDANTKSAIIKAWRSAKYPIVFTGAGMSTESGLPDFRSVRGLWRTNPESLATTDALEKMPNDFYFFYQWRIAQLWEAKPNLGHLALAKMEKAGLVKCIITQNVDGLHQRAGSKEVDELHGTLRTVRCSECNSIIDSRELLPNSILSEAEYKSGLYHYGEECCCRLCKGKLRPNVVLFGEALPEKTWEKAMSACKKTDFIVSIGSSLAVSPANMCPQIALNAGAKLLIINNDPTPLDKQATWVVSQNAGTVLNEIAQELLESNGWETLLSVGAEGGCITLFGHCKTDGSWLYHVTTDETTLLDLLEGEDRINLGPISKQNSRITDSWEEALVLLSRYPWIELFPMHVHVEFREKILTHIESKTGRVAPKWKRACSGPT